MAFIVQKPLLRQSIKINIAFFSKSLLGNCMKALRLEWGELFCSVLASFDNLIKLYMIRFGFIIFACACVFILQHTAIAKNIFEIGKPDASAAEFNDFGIDFNAARFYFDETKTDPYAKSKKFFSTPLLFDVRRQLASEFPFVLPVKNCEWADASFMREPESNFYYPWSNRYNGYANKKTIDPVSIMFNLGNPASGDLYLKIGFVDKAPAGADIKIRVFINEKEASRPLSIPYKVTAQNKYPCFENILFNSKTWGIPAGISVKIPAKLLKSGANKITLQAICDKKNGQKPQWFAFDYIILSDTPDLPEVDNPLAREGKKALEALGCDKIAFTARGKSGDVHWYGNFGRFAGADSSDEKIDARLNACAYSVNGGRLGLLDVKTGKLKILVDDPVGGVRDPVVSFDAKKIMYSHRKDGQHYKIFEIDLDSEKIVQMPFWEEGYDDIEPAYLPDGDIIFVSSRCRRMVPCWGVDVAILHRYYASENLVRPISVNVDQDNSPWPTSDGKIIYMKWEYVQKNQMNFHALWRKETNGANDMVYFGNDIPNHLYIDAKEIPGAKNSYVLTFSEWHGRRDHLGRVAFLRNPRNPADTSAFSIASGETLTSFSYPFPLSERYALVSDFDSILIIDDQGHIFQDIKLPVKFLQELKRAGLEIKNPVPIKKSPKPQVVADTADYDDNEATVSLVDAAIGRNMGNIKGSDIKRLLVSEVLPLACHLTGGMEPITMLGTFSLERPLGTVKVEDDGSAHFKIPANRALSFTALDADGKAVKKMQSFVSFAPGTTTSCIGCHERRDMAPPPIAHKLKALRRPADRPAPIPGVKCTEVPDFVRDIQPILSKYCIDCHNPQKFAAKIDLTPGMGPMFARSYYWLYLKDQISDGFNGNGNMAPYGFGSGSSKLLKKLEGAHHAKRATDEELNLVKVWLDTGAIHAGSIAAAESGMLGSYYLNKFVARDADWEEIKDINEVFRESCASCHTGEKRLPDRISKDTRESKNWHFTYAQRGKNTPRARLSSGAVFNLTFPENSAVLMAPLSSKAGGRAGTGGHTAIFASRDDPRYRRILKAIEKAKDYVENQNPRYDSPNYKPKGAYLRAMKRFSVMRDGQPMGNFNAFDCDKKYWDLVVAPKPYQCPDNE